MPTPRGTIVVRPTSRLAGLACLLFLLWFASANYNNNLGFLLTYWLASAAVLSFFQTRPQLEGIEVHPTPPKGVFAGNTGWLTVRLTNTTSRSKYHLRLWITGGSPARLSLGPKQTRQVCIPIHAEVRGRWPLGPLLMDSTFPLGLFRAIAKIPTGLKLVVYPRPADTCPTVPGLFPRSGEESLDFAGFRDYQAGDSLRRIHWKGLAKGQGLKVSQFESIMTPDECFLDWNQLPAAKAEQRLQWLCRGLLDAERNGRIYGLRVPDHVLAPASGESHLHTCLGLLAGFPHDTPT